ncbi:MAG: hypothetical protein PHF12_04315, partial [Candidatus Omnitrophica bacterium]|nr:hypothetical protein [Candidatus Omnitrophota bacterium]
FKRGEWCQQYAHLKLHIFVSKKTTFRGPARTLFFADPMSLSLSYASIMIGRRGRFLYPSDEVFGVGWCRRKMKTLPPA